MAWSSGRRWSRCITSGAPTRSQAWSAPCAPRCNGDTIRNSACQRGVGTGCVLCPQNLTQNLTDEPVEGFEVAGRTLAEDAMGADLLEQTHAAPWLAFGDVGEMHFDDPEPGGDDRVA